MKIKKIIAALVALALGGCVLTACAKQGTGTGDNSGTGNNTEQTGGDTNNDNNSNSGGNTGDNNSNNGGNTGDDTNNDDNNNDDNNGDDDVEPTIPENAAAFVFDDGTLVIQLDFIPQWGDQGTAFAYDVTGAWDSRYALDGRSTHTINKSMSSATLMIGFMEGDNGKNTHEIPCSDFTVNKINTVSCKNAGGDDVAWTSDWFLEYTITTSDY